MKLSHLPVLPAALAVILTALPAPAAPAQAATRPAASAQLHVSPQGVDSAPGTATAPLRTIQAALDRATPGTTITLAPGVYRERPVTRRPGTAAAPITIEGPETGKDRAGRYRAVLYGTSRIVNIDHSHYVLQGFTIDGQERLAATAYPTDPQDARAFKDAAGARVSDGRLVYVGSSDSSRDVTGVVIRDMFLNGGGGECVRLRNNAHHNVVTDSTIQWCGMYGKGDDVERDRYHNGEGVYIGTSPKSTSQPMHADDASSHNVVTDNRILTYGSECFNVKENAHHNVFQGNECGFNLEPEKWDGSAIELRGHANVIADNVVHGSRGWGVKLRSDSSALDRGGNSLVNNTFRGNEGVAVRNDQRSTGPSCGNTFDRSPILEGRAIPGLDAPCPAGSIPAPTPAPAPSPAPSPAPAPAPAPRVVHVEAESGQVSSPMTVRTDRSAGGGKYVVAARTGGSVRYVVTVPEAGRYRLAGRVIAPSGSSNSLYYAVDGGKKRAWHVEEKTSSWTWEDEATLSLKAGRHTVVVSGREAGTQLDAFSLTRVG